MTLFLTLEFCYLQIDINDNGVSQRLEAEEEEEEDDMGDFEGIAEDTDEEYVPVEKPISSAPSTSTARKCKVQSKTDQHENGEAVEEDSKKDSVQCPVCEKSFKSKYYLKVHNRYTNVGIFTSNNCWKNSHQCLSFRRRHTGERPFGCLKCGKRYFRKENLLLHEIRDCAKVQVSISELCLQYQV